MSPYILDPTTNVSRVLAILMVRDNPSISHFEFVHDGAEVGAAYDEVITVTYERKRKPPTFIVADLPKVSEV